MLSNALNAGLSMNFTAMEDYQPVSEEMTTQVVNYRKWGTPAGFLSQSYSELDLIPVTL